jgi:hypothetical protein
MHPALSVCVVGCRDSGVAGHLLIEVALAATFR